MPSPEIPSRPLSDDPPPQNSRLLAVVLWLLVVGGLAALPMVWPADGVERSTLALFFGRFHPLVLHFPIALLAIVPLMELAGLFEGGRSIRSAAGFVLTLGAISAVAASVLGWLLAWAGGYAGDLVNQHMWAGCTLSLVSLLAVLLRRVWTTRGWWSVGIFYLPTLLAAVGLVTWTAHQGGQLTHGEKFLEEHMPAPVREWLGLPAPVPKKKPVAAATSHLTPSAAGTAVESGGATPPAAELSFFYDRIMPALDRTCVSCHNPNKIKGGLRMDTFAELMKGGESGAAVVPGNLEESELYRRITLPHDDEEFMPSGGKKPLSEEETRLIEQWIKAGASETAPLSAFGLKATPPAPVVLVQPTAPDHRSHAAAIHAWEKAWGLRLVPVSQVPTDGLILRTASAPSRCTNEALAGLAALADLVVDAELARTRVTDAGMPALAACHSLRRIDLTQTAVTSKGVKALEGLKSLEQLNLTGTGVDEAGLSVFRSRADLRIYAAHTAASAP